MNMHELQSLFVGAAISKVCSVLFPFLFPSRKFLYVHQVKVPLTTHLDKCVRIKIDGYGDLLDNVSLTRVWIWSNYYIKNSEVPKAVTIESGPHDIYRCELRKQTQATSNSQCSISKDQKRQLSNSTTTTKITGLCTTSTTTARHP